MRKGDAFEALCSGCLYRHLVVFEEVQTPSAAAVLDSVSEGAEAHVPLIWPLEATNALVKAFRRRHLSRAELFEYAQRLSEPRVAVDQEAAARAFTEVLTIAERYQLSTYDAAYVELAKRLDLPLATADGNILQAAKPRQAAAGHKPLQDLRFQS